MPSITPRTWTTPSGKPRRGYQVYYRDAGGLRRRKQFARKKDAEIWIADDLPALLQPASEASTTIEAAADIWLRACRLGRDGGEPIRPATEAQYRWALKDYILPELGPLTLGRDHRAARRRLPRSPSGAADLPGLGAQNPGCLERALKRSQDPRPDRARMLVDDQDPEIAGRDRGSAGDHTVAGPGRPLTGPGARLGGRGRGAG